ncbi:pescadillo [Nematocida sp. LUAm3]|nr:pescadillo [Nematocida sp. LUAm3]KAI5173641.1 pescadillo [Nematocida sp. LUAm2]KAI5176862.1 pescadillo [Nematocida sp. LUAm1]
MRKYYTNIVTRRTHVTREEALECLDTDTDELDRLCILTDIHPYIPHKDKLTNKSTRAQYRVSEIHRIRESEAYKKIHLKKENKRKTEKYIKRGQEEKIKDLPDDRMDYGKVLLEKYPSFQDVYEDLGEALTCLIISERLFRYRNLPNIGQEQDLLKKFQLELSLFYLYLSITGNQFKSFLTDSGVFYSVQIENHEIFWKEAYPLEDTEDLLGINIKIIAQNAEFYSYLLEKINFRLFKSIGQDGVDIIRKIRKEYIPAPPAHSGAFGAVPLNSLFTIAEHLKPSKKNIFTGYLFYIQKDDSLINSLQLLILALGGQLTDTQTSSSINICASVPEAFQANWTYARHQFIYDSCNREELQDVSLYRPGQVLPQHLCPFKAPLEAADLDLFNLSERKKEELQNLVYHRK